jgi:hypothetical protein
LRLQILLSAFIEQLCQQSDLLSRIGGSVALPAGHPPHGVLIVDVEIKSIVLEVSGGRATRRNFANLAGTCRSGGAFRYVRRVSLTYYKTRFRRLAIDSPLR